MAKIGNHHGVWRSHKKVSFNIAIEVSYVYIWVDKRSLKMPKMVNFDKFWKPYACSQTVLPDMTGQFQKDKNGLKIPKSNETFRVIFKECEYTFEYLLQVFPTIRLLRQYIPVILEGIRLAL